MNQRTERLGSEIQAVLGEIIARGEIKDFRVRDAGIITITWVRVTGDLSEARAAFTVFGADAAALEQVRRGLQSARAYLQHEMGRRLRTRKTATLSFEIDRSLDHSFRVDRLLRESVTAPSPSVEVAPLIPSDVPRNDGGSSGDGDDADVVVPTK